MKYRIQIKPAPNAIAVNVLFSLLLLVAVYCFVDGFLRAIPKEKAFSEGIRQQRCVAHYMPGYCDNLKYANFNQ